MRSFLWLSAVAPSVVGVFFVTFSSPSLAQITPDGTLGSEGSIVSPNQVVKDLSADLIQGGAARGSNLFHSFLEFNVNNGQRVYFDNPTGIDRILSRVTGSDVSDILGTLGVNGGADLFFLNPNGIIFGPNARLDLSGSFSASAGKAFIFSDGSQFRAVDPNAPPLLTVGVTPGIQYGSEHPGHIRNDGQLAVNPNESLTLVGQTVLNQGGLVAPAGVITLLGDEITLSNGSRVDVSSGLGGGAVRIGEDLGSTQQVVIDPGALVEASGLRIGSGGEVVLEQVSAPGGQVQIQGDLVVNTGEIRADGSVGGSVSLQVDRLLDGGVIRAVGTEGAGGNINVDYQGTVIQTKFGETLAQGATDGGSIRFGGGGVFSSSGTLNASGAQGQGGTVHLLGNRLQLMGADVLADGAAGGGQIWVGGGYQGNTPGETNAMDTVMTGSAVLSASGLGQGSGGEVIVWADGKTSFAGTVRARGGDLGGDGGFVEVSGKESLFYGGIVDTGAPLGAGGTLLLDPKNITIDDGVGTFAGFELLDPNGGNGTAFSDSIEALSTGNVVVTKPGDNFGGTDAGAVYLFDGLTGEVLSTLVGSSAGDVVGLYGVTALTNGNYVVSSSEWDNGGIVDAGAVTWGNGNTGITGVVSAANSLVGSSADDWVGLYGVTALSNGNYVVLSYSWDNGGIVNAGAVTWGNGNTGITGVVSAANSLVGSSADDRVGNVTALTNGNYVVLSSSCDNGGIVNAGAVTWGNGNTGITGVVSAANSLVGSSADDRVGNVTALTNGNYVVSSSSWNNGGIVNAGAVTWGNGNTGITGVVSASNSLVGSSAFDSVGLDGVTALTNGNYVVSSFYWNNGGIVDGGLGAVTWGNGNTGITGVVGAANSLVGSSVGDRVGLDVTALTNGNYVVRSPFWDSGGIVNAGLGAVTWGNGNTGITGVVSAANSLVGSSVGDVVGDGVTALTNGNYVVRSSRWDNGGIANVGAATWGNGNTGITGVVSPTNSLVGLVD